MKMFPIRTHKKAGSHPQEEAAVMGPTIGPAPAIEEK